MFFKLSLVRALEKVLWKGVTKHHAIAVTNQRLLAP